ncbi:MULTISPECIES: PP2C family protein-serine/threonine phosphatase [Streptomyces]|uniref:Integral membrane protein n=1 Tax=Streptomyces sviceus (strain ATCC 29083 / DSM 924 / JCM 4929 / NBRC 13980 / NCIMB 11184 / NRRL 5439 / UC 5370) TaxID=463191 RepID=B5I6P2_STRX2|nr:MULTISPECIES: PP2C family protein-serine/threonine phosphatase [Streptomyces]EDY60747.2 integral membrane protein [Streptomyces sviceus ATCC 29083]MYT10326.1 SpoIIE family protein phosphatase [Streptomyces sp. SID5470]
MRDRDRKSWLRGAPPPGWVRVLPVALLAGVCAATLASPDPLDIGFLLGAIPPLAVLSYRPLATAVLGGLVLVVLSVPVFRLNDPGSTDVLTVGFVAALSVVVSFVRSRRDAQLVTERAVAEAAQRAVVPPLPERVAGVRCAGLYRAAQHGTLVGGDFFDVREGPCGVRAVMGDVQGHGLSAVATVASLLGAFREAVLDLLDPESVAARLDRRLVVDSAAVRHSELFATAVVLEFGAGETAVRIVACGQAGPVLLRDGRAVALDVPVGTPLGLGLSDVSPPTGVTVPLRPGDRLFLASDGVWEARDASGAFYPLLDRITGFAGDLPDLIERVWADLVRYTPALQDDVTMLVLAPVAPETR